MSSRIAILLLPLIALCAPATGQDASPLNEFIRVEAHPEREEVVRCAIRVYSPPKASKRSNPMARMFGGRAKPKPTKRPDIVLISMIHFGEKAFFAKINAELKRADLVLYEEQGDQALGAFGAQAMSSMTDLSFQAVEIKPDAKTWRSADLTQDQTFRALGIDPEMLKRMSKMMKQFGNLKLDRKTLGKIPGMDAMIPTRGRIVQQIKSGAGATNAMPGKMGDLVLRQRNAIAIGEMTRASYEVEHKRVVVIYGAAHMSGIESYLKGPLGYAHKSTTWVDAVYKTAKAKPAPAPAASAKGGGWY